MSDEDRVLMVPSRKTETETETRGFQDQDQDQDSEVPRPRPRPRLAKRVSRRLETKTQVSRTPSLQMRLTDVRTDRQILIAMTASVYFMQRGKNTFAT